MKVAWFKSQFSKLSHLYNCSQPKSVPCSKETKFELNAIIVFQFKSYMCIKKVQIVLFNSHSKFEIIFKLKFPLFGNLLMREVHWGWERVFGSLFGIRNYSSIFSWNSSLLETRVFKKFEFMFIPTSNSCCRITNCH